MYTYKYVSKPFFVLKMHLYKTKSCTACYSLNGAKKISVNYLATWNVFLQRY